ncbi:MAG: pentapeptide repeat-containing protein [Thiohalospira sp.]|uniref:pentapeptide repeat-containing protein n=1 Tax=Thiohalospira sp. TaxID=3080549 RepID=UPI0039805F4D
MEHPIWYLWRDGVAEGPFPAGQIQRWILLGRVRREDSVSPDGEEWGRVEDWSEELIPEVLRADLTDPYNLQRLEAARRWADERVEDDPEAVAVERREEDEGDRPRMRSLHRRAFGEPGDRGAWRLVVAAAVVVALIGGAWWAAPVDRPLEPDCEAGPAPGVNWSYCDRAGVELAGKDLRGSRMRDTQLQQADLRGANLEEADLSFALMGGADLAGANLRGARLFGTDLRGVRLERARMAGANMAYANLRGADLGRVDLSGVPLGSAIWVDGRTCAPESVGECD